MNYEQKYKEALERAKDILSYKEVRQEDMEYLFPELKESEDEKIKNCIEMCLAGADEQWFGDYNTTLKDCLDWFEKQGEQKLANSAKTCKKSQRMVSAEAKEALWPDKYEGLTDFERTLADVCIGWIGEEPGWKQYIKDNADVLLKIAIKKFNSVQENPAWSEEDDEMLDGIILRCEKYGHQEQINWLKSLKERIGG